MRTLTNFLALFFTTLLMACSLNDLGLADKTKPSLEHLFHPALPHDVNMAIATGDHTWSTIERFTHALNTLTEISNAESQQIQSAIFGSGLPENAQISWDPTHDSAILAHTIGVNHPIFVANDSPSGDASPASLGIAGRKYGTPYLAMGSNPFRTAKANAITVNADMMLSMQNAVRWLIADGTTLKNVLLVNLDDSYWFRDYPTTKEWLTQTFGEGINFNDYQACDDNKFSGCIESSGQPDLIVVSQKMNDLTEPAILAAHIDNALKNGVPVLYLHWYREANTLGTAILNELQIQYSKNNYWSKHRITHFSAADLKEYQDQTTDALLRLTQNLYLDTWNFELANCDKNCANQPVFTADFEQVSKLLQQRLRYFDRQNQAIFSKPSHEFDKLLVLLADAYRADVNYPLDFKTTARNDFLRAYFADYAQYITRQNNSHPKNMGNFSRTEFPGVETFTTELDITSRVPFRAAGLYALPAQTITITRLDDSDTDVNLFINTIRDGATHEWDDKGYLRPKFLRSTSIQLQPNTPITLTPSYGGTLQLAFNKNHLPVKIRFEGVAQHPVWRSEEDNAQFQTALLAHEFDWAEILTPAFEVHSRHDLMMKTVHEHPQWPSGGAIASATMNYMHNYPHVLAGFKGPGIDVVDEIHSFAKQHNLTIDELDLVKHMNADQALCGYGCSGNPYDAYWSFSPIGHGDIHELGHGLERHRFRMTDALGKQMDGHAITNPYSYYSKTQYHKETGGAHSCQNLPFKEIFDDLVYFKEEGKKPAEWRRRARWNDNISLSYWSRGMATYLQFMMAAQAQGALKDGWHLWPRLHIIEREFNRAVRDASTWGKSQANVGFAGMTLDYAKTITNNDWMLIAMSHATQLDYRPLFQMYGFATSSLANNQVAAMNLTPTEAVFYRANGNDFCLNLDKPALQIDSPW